MRKLYLGYILLSGPDAKYVSATSNACQPADLPHSPFILFIQHTNMDRREAIRRVAFLMGGTISAPALSGLLGGCKPNPKESASFQSFTPDAKNLVAEIAETIIPETSTPGAKAAKVDEFIVTMIEDCYPEKDQKIFFNGLDMINKESQTAYERSFVELKPNERTEILKKVEKEAFDRKEKEKDIKEKDPVFYFQFKELALLGYFTSEPGATKALVYQPIPGVYDGCVPMKAGQKAWAM